MKQPPCKICNDRKIGCHYKCSKYIVWKCNYNKAKESLHKDADYIDYKCIKIEKVRKRNSR